jgi:hypothetical protein
MNYREFSPIFVIGRGETIRFELRYRTAQSLHRTSMRVGHDGTAPRDEDVYRNFASSAVFMALFIMVSSHRITR